MPRIVGDSKFYTFYLKQGNGRYSQDISISLPSVTSIIGSVYAAPALQRWNYTQTRDNIAGAVATNLEIFGEDGLMELLETLSDGDLLEEWLKGNKLRPQDVSKEAMERGSKEHEYLASLGNTYLVEGPEAAADLAERLLSNKSSSGYGRAIADWWVARFPRVVASEHTVFALEPHGGYAGSLDLVYETGDAPVPQRVLCDLKTRKAGAEAYTSDEIQVGAYELAWVAQTGQAINRRTILVAREDATWDEYPATTPPEVFLHLLAIASLVKGGE